MPNILLISKKSNLKFTKQIEKAMETFEILLIAILNSTLV